MCGDFKAPLILYLGPTTPSCLDLPCLFKYPRHPKMHIIPSLLPPFICSTDIYWVLWYHRDRLGWSQAKHRYFLGLKKKDQKSLYFSWGFFPTNSKLTVGGRGVEGRGTWNKQRRRMGKTNRVPLTPGPFCWKDQMKIQSDLKVVCLLWKEQETGGENRV